MAQTGFQIDSLEELGNITDHIPHGDPAGQSVTGN